MKLNLILFFYLLFWGGSYFTLAQQLPKWEKGYLDIHHINTGRGDAAFCVFPDGTTLLIDAGDVKRTNERTVAAKPNDTRPAGQWVTRYLEERIPEKRKKIDYYLLTHYHDDHIGGIYDVYERFPCCRLLDRGSRYTAKLREDQTYMKYQQFMTEHSSDFLHENFCVGSTEQISLQYDQASYAPHFCVRNLYANGILWKGEKENCNLFPDSATFTAKTMPRENMYSCAIKITYGEFDYYTGGDVPGYLRPGRPIWQNIETPLSKVVGKVEIAVANHHGNGDGTNEDFISNLAPQNFILSTWDALHPEHKVLYRMFSKDLYSEVRNVFATNLHPASKIVIGNLIDNMASLQGHIVIRVLPGGYSYLIYVLEDGDDNYLIKSSFGPFTCS